MKSSKECECFPYTSKIVCYMEVKPDGSITQLTSRVEKQEALFRAETGQSIIVAVWPGRYRSDLFIIDDLYAFAEAQVFCS